MPFSLPKLQSTTDARAAMAAIAAGVAGGEITPSEGATLSAIVETFVYAIEANELDQRLSTMEAKGPSTNNRIDF